MPWLALPFANRQLQATLSAKYQVAGIPTLVILGPDGTLITKKGVEEVTKFAQD